MTEADMQRVTNAFVAAAERAAVAGCTPRSMLGNPVHLALTEGNFPSRFHRDSRSPRVPAPRVPLSAL